MPHSFEEVCGAVARGWCAPANSRKEMDVDLATAISKEVWRLIQEKQPLSESRCTAHGFGFARCVGKCRDPKDCSGTPIAND